MRPPLVYLQNCPRVAIFKPQATKLCSLSGQSHQGITPIDEGMRSTQLEDEGHVVCNIAGRRTLLADEPLGGQSKVASGIMMTQRGIEQDDHLVATQGYRAATIIWARHSIMEGRGRLSTLLLCPCSPLWPPVPPRVLTHDAAPHRLQLRSLPL